MKLENIQGFIDRGYELIVRQHGFSKDRPYHALVIKDRVLETSHNHLGKTPQEALEGLEKYVTHDSAGEQR